VKLPDIDFDKIYYSVACCGYDVSTPCPGCGGTGTLPALNLTKAICPSCEGGRKLNISVNDQWLIFRGMVYEIRNGGKADFLYLDFGPRVILKNIFWQTDYNTSFQIRDVKWLIKIDGDYIQTTISNLYSSAAAALEACAIFAQETKFKTNAPFSSNTKQYIRKRKAALEEELEVIERLMAIEAIEKL
jgi:hypothetical protein